MKFLRHTSRFLAGVLALLSWEEIYAQGTVTFDGPPLIAPTDEFAISYYSEKGVVFTPIGAGQFGRSGGAPVNTAFPRNGSAYLFASFTYSLSVASSSGSHFALVSVDLAEFSTLYQSPWTVQFVGYKSDGSTVDMEFVTDGIIDGAGPLNDFETFYFDSRFADVIRVEVPTYRWSLDNMVFSNAVPEPGTGALGIVGAAVFGLRLFRRKRRF